jgi:hypothetical protein
MIEAKTDRAKVLAQNLVEILATYEEELMALELQSPAVGPLRRAVGIAIAEACYVITDHGEEQVDWGPSADGQTRRTG